MKQILKDSSTAKPFSSGFAFEKITGEARQFINKRKGKYDTHVIVAQIQKEVTEEADLKITHPTMSKQNLYYFAIVLRRRLSKCGLAHIYSVIQVDKTVIVSKKLAGEN